MVVIIVLIAVLLLLLAGNIFLVFMVSKKIKELKEIRKIDAAWGANMHTPVVFEKRDLQVETLKCRIVVLKQFVEAMNRMSMQEYLIHRLCNEELHDFFMKNTDFIHFEQSENIYADEVYFDVRLNLVKPNQFMER